MCLTQTQPFSDEIPGRCHGADSALGGGGRGAFARITDLHRIGIQRSEYVADKLIFSMGGSQQFKKLNQIVGFGDGLLSMSQGRLQIFFGTLVGVETNAVGQRALAAANERASGEVIFLGLSDPLSGVALDHRECGRAGGCPE